MDKQRKLYLMNKYRFPGFGNTRAALEAEMDMIACYDMPQEKKSKFILSLRESYKKLKEWYSQIDFDELKKEISEEDQKDFATLFITKKILDDLNGPLEKFIESSQKSNKSIGRFNPVFMIPYDLQRKIVDADLYKGICYSDRVSKLKREIEEIK